MDVPNALRPTYSTTDLDALAFNFRSVKKFVGEALGYMAVVKADAYGHGAVECSRRLSSEGIDWFGVALPEEGIRLREAGIKEPILCLGSFWPGQEDALIKYGLTPVIVRLEQAQLFDRAAAGASQVPYHVKVDTGMGRIGVRYDAADQFAAELSKFENIRLDGLMTHFAAADDLSENRFTDTQIDRFESAVTTFRDKGFDPTYLDLANSPGAIGHPRSRGNMVRLGGVLYGLGGDILPREIAKPDLRPIMTLRSVISHLKSVPAGESLGYGRTYVTRSESLIATIPIGYADGLPRGLSNKGRVLVNGTFAPMVGRISMDWTIVDVTEVPNAAIGDEIFIIGSQANASITAEDIAAEIGTISYEITCGITNRVRREFVGGCNDIAPES